MYASVHTSTHVQGGPKIALIFTGCSERRRGRGKVAAANSEVLPRCFSNALPASSTHVIK